MPQRVWGLLPPARAGRRGRGPSSSRPRRRLARASTVGGPRPLRRGEPSPGAGGLARGRSSTQVGSRWTRPGSIGMDYFRLGIACPFLEDESCSIHPDRPIACREYLVTSPPRIARAPRPRPSAASPCLGQASEALRKVGSSSGAPWVPLSLALEWAEGHPDDLPPRPGPGVGGRVHQAPDRPRDPSPGAGAVVSWPCVAGLRSGRQVGCAAGSLRFEAAADLLDRTSTGTRLACRCTT